MSDDRTRLDKYLWAIRIFKTRTLATKACDDGRVRLAGATMKPARSVAIGDIYDVRADGRKWTIKVTGIIQNRVNYETASQHYIDHTTEEDKQYNQRMTNSFNTGKRQSKTGRPTKKQRRDLNDLLGFETED